MKHTMLYMTLLAACAISACGKEEVKEPEKELPMASSEYISFKVSATSPSEETVITWKAVSDRIGVFVSDAGTGSALNDNAYYDAFTSTSSSRFFPLKDADKLKWEEGKKYDVALYYPFSVKMKDATSIPVSVDEDQTVSIPLTSMQLKKEQLFVSSLKSVERPDNGILEMALSPVVSFVKINVSSNLPVACKSIKITGEDGTALAFKHGKYDLFTSGLSEIDSVSSVINVKPASPVYLSRKPAEFIVNVNPQYAGKTLKIKCDLEGADFEEVTVDIPEGGLKPGVCVSYNVGMTADPVLLSANGTANTYIVNKADCLYAFNAKVKGNGKSGSFAWNFDGETCSKNNDASLSPSSAELLWYSIPEGDNGFINASPITAGSVMYDEVDGLIYFKTPKTFIDGNAVIAALNESGEIVWSWNIWAVEGWNADATAKKAGRYTVMDRNLGAVLGLSAKDVSDNVKAAGAIGNYYQWGRKDPFPAASEYQTATNVLSDWGNPAYTTLDEYKVEGDKIFSADRTRNGRMLKAELGSDYSLQQAVDESVKYPHKWMFGGQSDAEYPQYSWFTGDYKARSAKESDEWRYLWGSKDNVSNDKTLYDPCPEGWKVPTADAFAYIFSDGQVSSGKHGFYIPDYDLYFPYAGQRKAGFGGSSLAASGEIMIASASVANSLYPIRASVSASGSNLAGARVTSSNSYAGAGYQVRCVKETVEAKAPAKAKQSGHRAALMGDSITRTWKDRGRMAFFTENNYLNKGIDGTTSSNMINRFWSDIMADDPQLAVISCGTNDLAENDSNFSGETENYRVHVSIENLLANIALMSRIAEDSGIPVVLGSVCPSRSMWWKPQSWKGKYDGDYIANKIIEANKLIKAYAAARGYGYADYHSALKNEENGLADKYCWVFGKNADGTLNLDSVHPNADAFLVMEGILKPLIDAGLYDPSQAYPGGGQIDDMDKWKW